MARPGITDQQVFDAAEQLLLESQSVTPTAVRDLLGTGSFSTIAAMLATWKKNNSPLNAADIPAIPDNVSRVVQLFWSTAWKEAQAGIRTDREALDAARKEMEREQRGMYHEIARLETENAQQAEHIQELTIRLTEETHAVEAANQARMILSIENARLEERAKAAEQLREALQQQLDQLHLRFQELHPE